MPLKMSGHNGAKPYVKKFRRGGQRWDLMSQSSLRLCGSAVPIRVNLEPSSKEPVIMQYGGATLCWIVLETQKGHLKASPAAMLQIHEASSAP